MRVAVTDPALSRALPGEDDRARDGPSGLVTELRGSVMFARHTFVTGDPRTIDDAITATTKKGRELLHEQPGYAGMAVFADRDLGKLLIGSFWETEQAARDSDEALREQRAQLLAPFAATIAVDVLEVGAMHRSRDAGAGAMMRRLVVDVEPAEADRLIETFRGVASKLDAIPGFCRATVFLDRARGRGVIGLVYADRDALVASRSAAAAVRAEVAQQAPAAVATRSLEEFEVVLMEAPQP